MVFNDNLHSPFQKYNIVYPNLHPSEFAVLNAFSSRSLTDSVKSCHLGVLGRWICHINGFPLYVGCKWLQKSAEGHDPLKLSKHKVSPLNQSIVGAKKKKIIIHNLQQGYEKLWYRK